MTDEPTVDPLILEPAKTDAAAQPAKPELTREWSTRCDAGPEWTTRHYRWTFTPVRAVSLLYAVLIVLVVYAIIVAPETAANYVQSVFDVVAAMLRSFFRFFDALLGSS